MNMNLCLWCAGEEPSRGYVKPRGSDFVCSSCVQMFLAAGKEKMERLWAECKAKGLNHKLRALRCFVKG